MMIEDKNTKVFYNIEIPHDWEVKNFEDVADIDCDSLSVRTPKDYEFDYISLSDVDSDDFKIETTRQVFASAPSRARRVVKKGDILMSTVRPNLQGFSLIRTEVKDLIASTGFAVLTSKKCSNEFLFQYLFSSGIERQFYQLLVGSNYPAINSSDVRKLKIPLPPLPEQKAIAQVLSTADAAINTTEKLIIQKELRKKWLMQQLLTGKLRLRSASGKRFEGEWKSEILGNVVTLQHGYQFRDEDFVELGIPVIKIRNVIGYDLVLTDMTFVDASRLEEFNSVVIENGDLLMSLTGNIGRVVEVKGIGKPMFQNYRVGKFTPIDSRLTKSFLKFVLSSDILFKQFNSMSNQSAQANFGKQDMDKLKFSYPTFKEEQTAIAQVLQAADKEISLLKAKAEKLREQKKWLMQVLLTGKVRLFK